MNNVCHSGSVYKVNQGVINVNFVENSDNPPAMTEEDINDHPMWVVVSEHYNMKKGLEIFGERGEKAVTK